MQCTAVCVRLDASAVLYTYMVCVREWKKIRQFQPVWLFQKCCLDLFRKLTCILLLAATAAASNRVKFGGGVQLGVHVWGVLDGRGTQHGQSSLAPFASRKRFGNDFALDAKIIFDSLHLMQ